MPRAGELSIGEATRPADGVDRPASWPERRRNPRGQGARLRDEIIDAATAILERTGSEYALSLRGIAREVGIAAPSISAHFADLFEIIDAVTARETTVVYEALAAAAGSASDPVERLFAVCRAYLRYGAERPARYRMLIGRRSMDAWAVRDNVAADTATLLAATLELATDAIRACVDAGCSASADPYYDTLILWFSLDGLVSVRAAMVSIDWPAEERLLADCVRRAARLTAGLEGTPG